MASLAAAPCDDARLIGGNGEDVSAAELKQVPPVNEAPEEDPVAPQQGARVDEMPLLQSMPPHLLILHEQQLADAQRDMEQRIIVNGSAASDLQAATAERGDTVEEKTECKSPESRCSKAEPSSTAGEQAQALAPLIATHRKLTRVTRRCSVHIPQLGVTWRLAQVDSPIADKGWYIEIKSLTNNNRNEIYRLLKMDGQVQANVRRIRWNPIARGPPGLALKFGSDSLARFLLMMGATLSLQRRLVDMSLAILFPQHHLQLQADQVVVPCIDAGSSHGPLLIDLIDRHDPWVCALSRALNRGATQVDEDSIQVHIEEHEDAVAESTSSSSTSSSSSSSTESLPSARLHVTRDAQGTETVVMQTTIVRTQTRCTVAFSVPASSKPRKPKRKRRQHEQQAVDLVDLTEPIEPSAEAQMLALGQPAAAETLAKDMGLTLPAYAKEFTVMWEQPFQVDSSNPVQGSSKTIHFGFAVDFQDAAPDSAVHCQTICKVYSRNTLPTAGGISFIRSAMAFQAVDDQLVLVLMSKLKSPANYVPLFVRGTELRPIADPSIEPAVIVSGFRYRFGLLSSRPVRTVKMEIIRQHPDVHFTDLLQGASVSRAHGAKQGGQDASGDAEDLSSAPPGDDDSGYIKRIQRQSKRAKPSVSSSSPLPIVSPSPFSTHLNEMHGMDVDDDLPPLAEPLSNSPLLGLLSASISSTRSASCSSLASPEDWSGLEALSRASWSSVPQQSTLELSSGSMTAACSVSSPRASSAPALLAMQPPSAMPLAALQPPSALPLLALQPPSTLPLAALQPPSALPLLALQPPPSAVVQSGRTQRMAWPGEITLGAAATEAHVRWEACQKQEAHYVQQKQLIRDKRANCQRVREAYQAVLAALDESLLQMSAEGKQVAAALKQATLITTEARRDYLDAVYLQSSSQSV